MLAFFRRIRKSIIENGNTKRYVLYAVGEIILVVIGILIAIGLNNSNQDKIAKQVRDDKIIKMKQNIYEDSLNLEFTINFNRSSITNIDSLLTLLEGDLTFEKYDIFRIKFPENNMNFRTTLPNQGVYNELINSGEFSKIENLEFKDKVANYYILYNHFNMLINKFLDPLLLTEKRLFNDGLLSHKYFLRDRSDMEVRVDYQDFKNVFSGQTNLKILENHLYELKDLHQQIIFFYNTIGRQMIGLPETDQSSKRPNYD